MLLGSLGMGFYTADHAPASLASPRADARVDQSRSRSLTATSIC